MNDENFKNLRKEAAKEARRVRKLEQQAQAREVEHLRANLTQAGGMIGDLAGHVTSRAEYAAGVVAREAGPAIPGVLTGMAVVFAWPVIVPALAIHVFGGRRAPPL